MATLSIALCTYNGERYLPEQLASYLRQTRLPDELVVRDDGSTDGTVRVLEQFAAEAPFPVRLLPGGENLGYARNFERVIGACSGDLVALSDQDDVWLPQKLARLEDALGDDPDRLLAFSDADLVGAELQPLGRTMWENLELDGRLLQSIRDGGPDSYLYETTAVTGATVCFRRSLAERALPMGVDFWHDAWLALLAEVLGRVVPVPEPLVLYRQHGANQIGVEGPLPPLRERLGRALRRDPHSEATMVRVQTMALRFYEGIRSRAHQEGWLTPGVDRRLRSRIRHAAFRADPGPRRTRPLLVAREFASGRYLRYSGTVQRALYIAARDLLR